MRDQNQLEVFRGDTNCSLSRELAQSMSGSCTQQQIVGTGSSPMGNCCPRVAVISTSISLAGELMPEFCAAFPSSARLLCIPHFHQRREQLCCTSIDCVANMSHLRQLHDCYPALSQLPDCCAGSVSIECLANMPHSHQLPG